MSFTKNIKDLLNEILNLKQGGKVASTIRTYVFRQLVTIPASSGANMGRRMWRFTVIYKPSAQIAFTHIGSEWSRSGGENFWGEAMRSPIANGRQYVWISAPENSQATQYTFYATSTVEIQSVALDPE